MKIVLHEISIRDVSNGYIEDANNGVKGYGGLLNIRPSYQREFIYKDDKRNAVINTINNDYPLNVMYWVKNQDGTFEVLDGQQRTISICRYIKNVFSIGNKIFDNLEDDQKEKILNYKLTVYFCEGTASEKLNWFRTINIAGEKLTEQELRNATYHGKWLESAKQYFSKTEGPAYEDGAKKYLTGTANRQDYLETAIGWIIDSPINGIKYEKIEDYMSARQHQPTASELILYFQSVMSWIEATFKKYRKEMKGVNFGKLYNQYKNKYPDPTTLETEITKLLMDDDVTHKSGIYEYVLTRDQRALNIRAFTDNMKREAYERQEGVCPKCKGKFELNDMEADHITPWSQGGRTVAGNCQMLCKRDNRLKAGI